VEGLAQRIVNGDVPQALQNRQLIALDMGSLIAGAKYRGEFEKRLKAVLNEVTASEGQIVQFIDEIHTLVGAGASGGAMDASNLLKPMLVIRVNSAGADLMLDGRSLDGRIPVLPGDKQK